MATFYSNNDRGYYIRVEANEQPITTTDISSNSSRVSVQIYLHNTNVTFAGYSLSMNVTVHDQSYSWSGSHSMTAYNSNMLLDSRTVTVKHASDGTRSAGIYVNFNGSGGYSPGNLLINWQAYQLTKINRASTIAVPTATIGSPVAITIAPSDASYTHTLRYAWGNKSGTIVDKTTSASYSWTVPMTFANDIPNAVSGNGTIYVDTYSGSTLIGTSSATLTATVPSSVIPTLTNVVLSDTNSVASGITGESPNFIQIYSGIKVNFGTASGAYGSTIKSYYAEIVGKNISINSNGGTFSNLNFSGSFILRSKVIDSRGRESAVVDTNINILEYKPPVLNFTVARTGSTSSTFTITRNASISPLIVNSVQKNVMTLTFKIAPANSSTFTTDNGPASGSWSTVSSFINSQANLAGTYDATKSWRVQGILSDKFSSTTFEAPIVTTELVVMSYDKDGRVGIGKIADLSLPSGSVDSLGGFFVNGKSLLDMFYPVGTIYESVNATNPSTFMGGTWTRFGNGKVLVGVDENDADFNSANKTGGEKSHVLTKAEMPQHDHNVSNDNNALILVASSAKAYATAGAGTGSSNWQWQKGVQTEGGNQPHNNLQPYVTIYRWQRTA